MPMRVQKECGAPIAEDTTVNRVMLV